jgi:micrococcal nuclease
MILPLVVLLALSWPTSSCTNNPERGQAEAVAGRGQPGRPPGAATVITVVDGDTVELDFAGVMERVRLLGVDAPESVHPSVPVQCFGVEASAGLATLLPPGTAVRVERDVEPRDRYDRLLLYLYRLHDDLFVNRWLVQEGLADTLFYEPNTTLADPLREARSAARSERAGLWGACDGPDQPAQ